MCTLMSFTLDCCDCQHDVDEADMDLDIGLPWSYSRRLTQIILGDLSDLFGFFFADFGLAVA